MNAVILFACDHNDGLTTRDMFREVKGKPFIAWTLETLEHLDCVELIEVVCPQSLEEEMAGLFESYALQKTMVIVPPGECEEENYVNGLLGISDMMEYNSYVLFYDAALPMFDPSIIEDAFKQAEEYHAVISDPNNDGTNETVADSDMFNNFPQCYHYGELTDLYLRATQANPEEGRYNAPSTLMLLYGKSIATSKGDKNNIEIKSLEDFDIFADFIQKRIDNA